MFLRFLVLVYFAVIFVPSLRGQETNQHLINELLTVSANAIPEVLEKHASKATITTCQELLAKGDNLYDDGHIKQAEVFYLSSLQLSKQLKAREVEGISLFKLARVKQSHDQIKEAIAYYRNGHELLKPVQSPNLILLLVNLSTLESDVGDYISARQHAMEGITLAQALPANDQFLQKFPDIISLFRLILAAVAHHETNYEEALSQYTAAISEYKKLAEATPSDKWTKHQICITLRSIGQTLRQMGNYTRALAIYSEALEHGKTDVDENYYPSLLNSVGLLYLEQRDFTKALAYFSQSREIYSKMEYPIAADVGDVLQNIALCYRWLGRLDEALIIYEESYRFFLKAEDKDGQIAASSGYGVTLRLLGNNSKALEWLNKSLAMAQQTNNHIRIAEVTRQIGDLYAATGDRRRAIMTLNSALELAKKNGSPNLIYLTATSLGRVLLDEGLVTESENIFRAAINTIETARLDALDHEAQIQRYFTDKISAYHGLIESLIKQGRTREAFAVAEQSKGRVLLDVIRHGKRLTEQNLSNEEKEKEKALRERISNLQGQLDAEKRNPPVNVKNVERLTEELNKSRVDYESYLNVLSSKKKLNEDRTKRLSKFDNFDSSLSNLRLLLTDKQTALLEYVITERRTLLFAVTAGDNKGEGNSRKASLDVRVYEIPLSQEEVARLASDLRERISDPHSSFNVQSQAAYKALIKPAEEQIRSKSNLTIVPDSHLWEVPFASLIAEDNRYLIEDKAINLVPSFNYLLTILKQQRQTIVNGNIFAIGNPFREKNLSGDGDCQLPRLPEAEVEVMLLSKLYGKGKNLYLVKESATETAFKNEAGQFHVLHIATHGILDNTQPLYSYLTFAPMKGDDGKLEAWEIMNLNLRADFVVLSACDTARGSISHGEGVVGMSWAFMIAGAQATLVSQWQVNSKSTSEMMAGFHHAFRSQRIKSRSMALREASLKLLKQPRYSHPYYWSSFILVGKDN